MAEDDDATYTRGELAELLGVDVKTLGAYVSRTRKAAREGRDITRRPYRWFPLPDDRDRWPRRAIADYLDDRPFRQEGLRSRARGPAFRIVVDEGEPCMVVQISHHLTRDQLADALWFWRIDHGMAALPRSRDRLVVALRESLEKWGRPRRRIVPSAEAARALEAAVNILWPKED